MSTRVNSNGPEVSVVVPLRDEEENVRPLVQTLSRVLGSEKEWEVILVDDGSRDRTAAVAQSIADYDSRVRLVRLARNYGQSAALQAGFDHASGNVVLTMDGDLQNDPRDIPRLIEKLWEGYDLVAGYRSARQDALITRKLPSWLANRIIQRATGVPIRDTGCSLRAYRRELIQRVHVYSDLHRFLPALAAGTAGARVTEVPVRHHARRFGRSKYGLSRILKVQLDLLTLKMIHSFRERPLALFGSSSIGAFLIGLLFIIAAAATASLTPGGPASVFPAAGLLWLMFSWYLLLLGLIGEVALREGRRRRPDPASILWEERP